MKRISILLLSIATSSLSHAFGWSDLWFNHDQNAAGMMEKGNFIEAKETFRREDWAATAAYRAGDYEKASLLFESLKTKDGYYNQGNALAHLGQYEKAIAAYNNALQLDPTDKDVLFNKKLIKELMKKDKNKEENKSGDSQQNKDQQNKDQQNKDQQNKDQQNKDQQNKDQQNKDQQNKDQQNKDQQNKDQQNKDQQNKDQQNKDQQNKDQQNKDQQNKDPQKNKNKQGQQNERNNSKKITDEVQSQQDKEKQEAKEQWLRLIPDDPGGLMREKFLRDHLRRQRGWYQ